jgi:WD40 repeat protein
VIGLSYSPDGKTLAAVAEDAKVHLLDAATFAVRRTWTLPGSDNNLRTVGWANDKTVVCRNFSTSKAIVVLDADAGELKHSYARDVLLKYLPPGEEPGFVNMEVAPGTSKVLVRTTNAHGKWSDVSFLLDWQTGEASPAYRRDSTYGCHATAVAPDLSIAAQGDGFWNDIILWDPQTGQALRDGKRERRLRITHLGAHGEYHTIRWRPDGKAVAWKNIGDDAYAELDLSTLTLRPLKWGQYKKYGQDSAVRVRGDKLPRGGDVDPWLYERGLHRAWRPLELNWKWPNLEITGGPQPVTLKTYGPVAWDFTFAAGGLVVTHPYRTSSLQVFDPANGEERWSGVSRSYIRSLAVSPDAEGRYVLVGSADQTLTIFNPTTCEVLLTIFPSQKDWIAWTPQGYYAATLGGEQMMGWHVENGPDQLASFYPAARSRKKYHRPDVIKLVLEKGSATDALKAANAALPEEERARTDPPADVAKLLPPRVTLRRTGQDTDGTVTLATDIEVAVGAAPIRSLRLMIDRQPAHGDGFVKELAAGTKVVSWPKLELPPGPHRVVVLARTADASLPSNALTIDTRPLTEWPAIRLLAVGISNYADKDLNLTCADKDAELLAAAFKESCEGTVFGTVVPRVLPNDKATRDGILKELAALRTDPKRRAKANDLVVVFFAGHGAKEKDQFYLLPHDAQVNNLAGTAISGTTLRDELKDMPCGRVLLILDACHAAGFGEGGRLAARNLKPATDDATRALTDDDVGVAVMCAAMGSEVAEERSGHGLFTRALADALTARGGVLHNRTNRRQYTLHLQTQVFDTVMDETHERQHPFLHLPWVMEPFALRELPEK